MRISLLSSSVIALLASTATTAAAAAPVNHGKALRDWMVASGGFVHDGLEIKRSFGSAEDSPFYAIEAQRLLPQGTVLLKIPQSKLVKPHDEIAVGDRVYGFFEGNYEEGGMMATVTQIHDVEFDAQGKVVYQTYDLKYVDGDEEFEVPADNIDRHLNCATVKRLVEEMELGEASGFAPYINYLLSQPKGQLPPAWSPEGKELLNEVLGEIVSQQMAPLPPELELADRVEDVMMKTCELETDVELNFFHLLNQRGWDEVLIPVFDMMSHGNGRLLNTDHGAVREGDMVIVKASRDIQKGEELYTTYNMCPDCENRYMGYGTPELMRDYGFVENFPQRWFFWPFGRAISFEMDQVLDIDGNVVPEEYTLEWLEGRPTHRMLVYFRNQLVRLQTLVKTTLSHPPNFSDTVVAGVADTNKAVTMPESEWNTIVQFTQATMLALTQALKKSGVSDYLCDGSTTNVDSTTDENNSEFFCNLASPSQIYDDLSKPDLDEWVDDRPDTCNAGENDENHPYHRNDGEILQAIQSPYQKIEFYSNLERNNDTCFMLDQGTYFVILQGFLYSLSSQIGI